MFQQSFIEGTHTLSLYIDIYVYFFNEREQQFNCLASIRRNTCLMNVLDATIIDRYTNVYGKE